jgi:N-acetylglucosamine-6-sulfatase
VLGGRPRRRIARVVSASLLAWLIIVFPATPSHAEPVVLALSPTHGPVGATVTVTGSGLLTTNAVYFGTVSAEFTVVTDEEITAVVPAGSVTATVEVDTVLGNTTSADPFVVQPNILVVISDDQRWDTLSSMPNVQSKLVDRGIKFSNAFVENPLCCPSRVNFLTGQDSHTSGIWTNTQPYGGFQSFTADDQTVATWLNDAGYQTILAGKYLNHYWDTDGSYVPPGWDVWRAFDSATPYYDYAISVDGTLEQHGSAPQDYSTDVIAQEAETAIRDTSAQDPVLLWFTPFAPHGPATPAPRDAGTLDGISPWRPKSYDEHNVTDKPGYIRSIPRWSPERKADIDALRQSQLESLGAVDDAVGGLLQTLQDTGRLGDTLIIYTSDNGYLWGEHRRVGKEVAYEESVRVPFVVRWDRVISSPHTDQSLVENVDVAPTLVSVSRGAPETFDGRSLVPLLDGGPGRWRTRALIEHLDDGAGAPSYCAIRTSNAIYIRYATTEEEYYRLAGDPLERTNKVSYPAFTSRIAALRVDARKRCDPLPPGMDPF